MNEGVLLAFAYGRVHWRPLVHIHLVHLGSVEDEQLHDVSALLLVLGVDVHD